MTSLLLLALTLPAAPPDWPALVQKPYESLPVADIGLRPLLKDSEGKPITTLDGWKKKRQEIVRAWEARLGKGPAKPEKLAQRTEKSEPMKGYRRDLVSFQSEEEDRIRGWLLVPDGIKEGEKRPVVVVFHQTTRDLHNEPAGLGKNPTLALALHLVQRGYITLSPECYILKDGWARSQAEVLAKRRPGWTGMAKMTFDASRCIDYLETLPYVDADRIGCIGHSLGAKEVLFALALEPRYKAGVFSEGGIGLRMSNWTDPWYLTEAFKPHIPALENHQILALAAPKPFLLIAGDSADGDTSWTFIKAALPVYKLHGAEDCLGMYNHHAKHTMPTESRRIAYRWLDHWLKHTPTHDEVGP